MKSKDVQEIFRGRKRKTHLNREYAVLVPLVDVDGEPHLLFQVRSGKLARQPGEISFPGGMIEEGEGPEAAAVRETMEEMGLMAEDIEVIGELDFLQDSRNGAIYPYLGRIKEKKPEEIHFLPDEVAEIFTVPLEFFLQHEPEVYNMSYKVDLEEAFPYHRIPNGGVYQARTLSHEVFFYEYGKYLIWGLTAKITRCFVHELKDIFSTGYLQKQGLG